VTYPLTSDFCSFSDVESCDLVSGAGASGVGEAILAVRGERVKIGDAQSNRRDMKRSKTDALAADAVGEAIDVRCDKCDAMRCARWSW
jgi:hypothetical protein